MHIKIKKRQTFSNRKKDPIQKLSNEGKLTEMLYKISKDMKAREYKLYIK